MSHPAGSQAWWESRYASADPLYPTPSEFLEQNLTQLTLGEALDLGMGEGQNAAMLAKRGFKLTGIDFSKTALERARKLFAERNVPVEIVAQDLQFFLVPLMKYALMTVVDTKPPLTVLKGLARGLAPGGKLVVEGHLMAALGKTSFALDASECYQPQELLGHLQGLKILVYDERPSAIPKVRAIATKG